MRNRFADVLGVIVTRFRCELDAGARPIRAQELLRYISRVDRLIDPEDPHPLLDTHQRAQVADAQTDAYLALSNQTRSELPIVSAMMSLEKLLHHTSRTDTPLDRASLEFDLGAANAQLSPPLRLAYLSRSVAAAKAALNAYPRTGALQEARWLTGALSEQQRTQFRGWLDVVDRDLATHSKTSGSGFTNQRGF